MLRCTVISDTHGKESQLFFEDYKGIDKTMLIHCGDYQTHKPNTQEFLFWFSQQDFDYHILVAGNHDSLMAVMGYDEAFRLCNSMGIIYLEDTSVEIEGIKIHGSPWSNRFGSWCFMDNDFELEEFWQKIPNDTEVLITHGPAYGTGDKVYKTYGGLPNAGSRTLQNRILELDKLKFHLTGHIHESYGEYKGFKVTTYNAALFDYFSKNLKKPWVFEIESKDN